jgi:formimidoylglutamate deiminase
MTTKIWAASALLAKGWANNVEITIDEMGNIESIISDTTYAQGERYNVIIPGIPNVHSHAHQRAMSGLGERASISTDGSSDSFWSWRKVMYHYLERIQPEHLLDISSQLYLEMLKHGYTCVGEFQYLHHDQSGQAYDNRAEMSLQCLQAAENVGLGFTGLPVLYRYGGFGDTEPLAGQKRFLNDADGFIEIVHQLQQACQGNANHSVGIAPHSLRAVNKELLANVIEQLGIDKLAAIHVHVAEQRKEVDDCLAWSQQRPVEWLMNHFEVDQNWCLIHATHMTETETLNLAKSGGIAGICPVTEGNLGDGFFNGVDYFANRGNWAIGSDSHTTTNPVEELRWFEYGQRLLSGKRNVLVSDQHANTGRNLLEGAWHGGAMACGRKIGKIENGYRADFVVLDESSPRLYSRSEDELLDSWIFSGSDNLIKDVYVGGKHVIKNGCHINEESIAQSFRNSLDQLAS